MRETVITKDMIADPNTRYGNGRSATRHFIVQRVTGAINVLFIAFLVFIVLSLAGEDRGDVVAVIGNPLIGVPFAILFAIVCVHMRIGMREIIEDYVHETRTNRLSLSLNSFFALAVGLVGAVSILKLVFWG
jgi:succinate dehydrogenase / fumarate reductase membrane anchor subunit